MKKINKTFLVICTLILAFELKIVDAAVDVTPGGFPAPSSAGCPTCSWTYTSNGLGVRLSLYKYDGKNLSFKASIDLVNEPSLFPSKANTTRYKYGRYSYTKLGKTIDFAYYDVGAVDINSFGFSTIDENNSNWSTKFANEVQSYFGKSESDTIKGIKNMFGVTTTTSDLSQYYIVAEPTAFFYSRVGQFYTYATGYEYMVILDDIDIDIYTGNYDWNLWESQGRVTFMGYMFNGMYNQTNASKKYEGFTDGRYDYYNFLAQGSNTSIVKTTSTVLTRKAQIRNNNAYAKSNYEYGVMIFWIGANSTKIGGCSSACANKTGDALLKCAENYCSTQDDVTNSTQKGQCITDKCNYTYTKLKCDPDTSTNGSDTSCGATTSSNKKTCKIVNNSNYSYKVECNTYSTVTYPDTLPTTISAGQGFEYRVRLYGNKTCTLTFDIAKWKYDYAASYSNSERQNYLDAINDFNKLALTSYYFDSSTANISVKINERKNGKTTTTTKNLVAEENYEKGDKVVRSTYATTNISSYHNNSTITKSIKTYTTDSSNSTYYELPGVCISSKDHLTVTESSVCGDDNGSYNVYYTSIYADETKNNVTATVTHNASGMENVKNTCDYTVTNDQIRCYIEINQADTSLNNAKCGNEILSSNYDATFTLYAVYKDKTKTIRYNIDTTGYKSISDQFNNKTIYPLNKSTIDTSKKVTVYGTVTDGTYLATCTKEFILTPQTCEWIKTKNTSTGEITLKLKSVSDSSAKYYTKLSTSNKWLQNQSVTIDSNTTVTVNGKIVTSTGTYSCEYSNKCDGEKKYCTTLYKPAEKQKIKDYCTAHWREDGANYTSYDDCYTSCTTGTGLTCKKKYACTEISNIRLYCQTSYQNDGYETIATCINDCACSDNGIDYYYRTISLNNPFPQREANANWLGFEEYITNDKDDLTSSTSGSPEYEIVLDAERINAIKADTKRYNSITGNDVYNDYVWEDDEPVTKSPYKSKFIHVDDTSDGGFKSYFTYIEGAKTS